MSVVKTDTDKLYYRREDTEWIIPPDDDDFGVLGAKAGAVPLGETRREAEQRLRGEKTDEEVDAVLEAAYWAERDRENYGMR